jgi:hydrogenase maturation protein HypF
MTRRVRVFIRGMVQGVGMRPFVALLAKEFGIHGTVKNIGSNVEIIAEANANALDAFVAAIRERKPEMSEINEIAIDEIETDYSIKDNFQIIPSTTGNVSMLPADFPVCADCARELFDKTSRRLRHPFISCAVCGPRYSIIKRAPYDRANTSMDEYPMCPDCEREYNDPNDRRYHAETVCCHNCGPQLVFEDREGRCEREDALQKTIACLKGGGIVAVKGVGGYHLACSPHDEEAVRRLRALKGRELKPFAVLFRDMEAIRQCCEASPEEEELLRSPARPIVLLNTIGSPFAPSVSGDARLTGAFLPYTPLQMLLLEQCQELVMTSANRSGKPEIYEDAEMLGMLAQNELSGVLYNGRKIVTRLDDSVARINTDERQLIRRSRGYAPRPVTIKFDDGRVQRPAPTLFSRNIIAYGSDLKSAFCLLRRSDAYMSQYFGDMEEMEVQRAYQKNMEHMQELFSFKPEFAVCDMHPGYHSSGLARQSGLPIHEVQHHHAHAASVMAEHNLKGPVIGVAFDGTGYGADGAVWGGEFLLCNGGEFTRRAHLGYVTLAGGDSVAVDARKAALCYCEAAGVEHGHGDFEGAALLRSALANNVNTVRYSGMGRLFDAVASLLGIRNFNGYEGECAIALENAAHSALGSAAAPQDMDFEILEFDDKIEISVLPVIRAVAGAGQDKAAAALGFHNAVCRMVFSACTRIREKDGASAVALSGGTFQNELILSGCMGLLRRAGFDVYTNNEVPCNDGGLALGQAYIAAMRNSEG